MFLRLALILVLTLSTFSLRAELSREDLADLSRFYLFAGGETSSSQIVTIECSGENASLSPTLAARLGNVWIDSGIGNDIYAIDHIQVWWPGNEPVELQPSEQDLVTSTVLTSFVGNSRWVGMLTNAPPDHPVKRNRSLFAAASALKPDGFVLQDIQAGDTTLQQLHALFPETPQPLGLYVRYREVGTAH